MLLQRTPWLAPRRWRPPNLRRLAGAYVSLVLNITTLRRSYVTLLVILTKDERRFSSDESDATRVECRGERIRVWHKLPYVAQRREVTCHPERDALVAARDLGPVRRREDRAARHERVAGGEHLRRRPTRAVRRQRQVVARRLADDRVRLGVDRLRARVGARSGDLVGLVLAVYLVERPLLGRGRRADGFPARAAVEPMSGPWPAGDQRLQEMDHDDAPAARVECLARPDRACRQRAEERRTGGGDAEGRVAHRSGRLAQVAVAAGDQRAAPLGHGRGRRERSGELARRDRRAEVEGGRERVAVEAERRARRGRERVVVQLERGRVRLRRRPHQIDVREWRFARPSTGA